MEATLSTSCMFMDDVMNDAWINTNIEAHLMIETFRFF